MLFPDAIAPGSDAAAAIAQEKYNPQLVSTLVLPSSRGAGPLPPVAPGRSGSAAGSAQGAARTHGRGRGGPAVRWGRRQRARRRRGGLDAPVCAGTWRRRGWGRVRGCWHSPVSCVSVCLRKHDGGAGAAGAGSWCAVARPRSHSGNQSVNKLRPRPACAALLLARGDGRPLGQRPRQQQPNQLQQPARLVGQPGPQQTRRVPSAFARSPRQLSCEQALTSAERRAEGLGASPPLAALLHLRPDVVRLGDVAEGGAGCTVHIVCHSLRSVRLPD